jgi:hypothetical protein
VWIEIQPFLGLSKSAPGPIDLWQDSRKVLAHLELFPQYLPPSISYDGSNPLIHERHLTSLHSPAEIVPDDPNLHARAEYQRGVSPSDSSIASENTLESDFDHILAELTSYTTALLDLLPSISHSLALIAKTETKDVNQFTIKILDKYGKENQFLKERLGDANMKRYERLLRIVCEPVEVAPAKIDHAVVPPSILDSGFFSGTMSMAPPALVSKPRAGSYSPSFYSFYTSTATGRTNNEDDRLPTTPEEVGKGLPFTCEICWHVQRHIKSREDWKYV